MASQRIDRQLYNYIAENPDIYAHVERSSDGGKPRLILVVEDDDLLRRVIVHKLQKAGYAVIEATNGDDALTRFRNQSEAVDLVLTDVIMPGMNGRQAVAEIRRLRPAIAVLYMSGYPSDVVANRGALEPGIDFIEKAEVIGDGFVNKIREILNRTHPH